MSPVVFDASAILAILKQEPGYETARNYLGKALISTVNLTEFMTKLIQLGYDDDDVAQVISSLNLQSIPFTDDLVETTAHLFRKTKPYGLSLGDRACLALGISKNLLVLTADRVWAELDMPIEVKLIR